MINNLLCIRQRKSEFFFYYAKYIQLFVSLRNNFRLSLKHTFFNFLNLFTLTNSPNLNFHAFSFEERENALNCTAAATEQNPRLSDIHLDLGLNAIFPSPSAPFSPTSPEPSHYSHKKEEASRDLRICMTMVSRALLRLSLLARGRIVLLPGVYRRRFLPITIDCRKCPARFLCERARQ